MKNYDLKKMIGRKFTFIVLVIPVLLYYSVASGQNFDIKISTNQNKNTGFSISKKDIENGAIYGVSLVNQSKTPQNLKKITVSYPDLIPSGTQYMAGAYSQAAIGQMIQYNRGVNDSAGFSNMYLLFRFKESDYLLVGMVTWQSFLCEISVDRTGVLQIDGDGDNKLLDSEKKIDFDKFVILKGSSWQDLLYEYASVITKENQIPAPPKLTFEGWSTWDFYTRYFEADDVYENINAMRDMGIKMNMIQIDGGWWQERGDYFEVRDNLPGGIKAIVENIHKRGYKAGLHFDGFRVSTESKIFKEHPEFFIRTSKGEFLNQGDTLAFWDYSNPGAREYMKAAIKNARENWNVDYFKIDFMRWGLRKGVSYLPVTNLERFRMGIEAMKEGMGQAYFLGCSANFGSILGLVDGLRVGGDINPDYKAVVSRVAHTSGSFYFGNEICNIDPDYLVLRSEKENEPNRRKRASLTYKQAAIWSNYISIFGNVRLESDKVNILSEKKKELIKRTFKMPFFTQTIPLDFWDHYKTKSDPPRFFLARTDEGEICVGLFNWESSKAKFTLSGFDADSKLSAYQNSNRLKMANGRCSISLKGESSILLKYEGEETFDQLRKRLRLTYDGK